MTKKTWSEFKSSIYLEKFYPEINNHTPWWTKERTRWRRKAVQFIQNLLKHKVLLSQIDFPDWHLGTLGPSPYLRIGKKKYTRLAKNDYKLALKHLKELKP